MADKNMGATFQVGDKVWWLGSDSLANGTIVDEAAVVTKVLSFNRICIEADNRHWQTMVGASELEPRSN